MRAARKKALGALIVAAVALAGCNASDPQPTASEIFALRAECGKMGEAWIKQHPLPEKGEDSLNSTGTFYSSKENRCWVIVSNSSGFGAGKIFKQHETLYDAQTGAEVMTCYRENYEPTASFESRCRYILKVTYDDTRI